MTVPLMLWVHRLNSGGCLLLGTAFNCLLIWLILARTPKEKRMHSQILLQTCVMDLLVLLLAELVQPVFFLHHGVAQNVMVGQLAWLPNPAYHALFLGWFIAFYFSLVGLGVQFVYRWLIICKSAEINATKYFGMLTAAFVAQVPLLALMVLSTYPGYDPNGDMVEDEGVVQLLGPGPGPNGSWRVALRQDPKRPLVLIWAIVFMVHNSVLYAVIIWCSAKIRISMAKHMALFDKNMSKWSGELNAQITRTLLVQAFLPIFPLALCCLGVGTILFSPESAGQLALAAQMLITVPFGWLPVANPLVSLLVVKQYRRWLLKFGSQLRWQKLRRVVETKPTAEGIQQVQQAVVIRTVDLMKKAGRRNTIRLMKTIPCTNR